MKILRTVLQVLIVCLGISAGIAKILLVPEEVEYFNSIGLTSTPLILFGIAQLMGAVFFIFQKSRKAGNYILLVTFCLSTILIFSKGQIGFGLFSFLPVIIIILLNKMNKK